MEMLSIPGVLFSEIVKVQHPLKQPRNSKRFQVSEVNRVWEATGTSPPCQWILDRLGLPTPSGGRRGICHPPGDGKGTLELRQ